MENSSKKVLEILFQDEHIVAINKPYGWLTHKSAIARDATDIVLQTLRDQLNQKVYPIHRLDRKTTGILLFGLSSEVHSKMSKIFQNAEVKKTYYAITRGFTEKEGIIDYPLVNEAGNSQTAFTRYKSIQHSEINVPLGKHSTSRYSLVKLQPVTGRMHQLRRHLSHIFHPIIGDRPHGCSKQNRFFKQNWAFTEMLLHASNIEFTHPYTDEAIEISAQFFGEFQRMSEILNFEIDFDALIQKNLQR